MVEPKCSTDIEVKTHHLYVQAQRFRCACVQIHSRTSLGITFSIDVKCPPALEIHVHNYPRHTFSLSSHHQPPQTGIHRHYHVRSHSAQRTAGAGSRALPVKCTVTPPQNAAGAAQRWPGNTSAESKVTTSAQLTNARIRKARRRTTSTTILTLPTDSDSSYLDAAWKTVPSASRESRLEEH